MQRTRAARRRAGWGWFFTPSLPSLTSLRASPWMAAAVHCAARRGLAAEAKGGGASGAAGSISHRPLSDIQPSSGKRPVGSPPPRVSCGRGYSGHTPSALASRVATSAAHGVGMSAPPAGSPHRVLDHACAVASEASARTKFQALGGCALLVMLVVIVAFLVDAAMLGTSEKLLPW